MRIKWLLIVVIVLCSCKGEEYIPVKEVHTEYRYTTDTVHYHDTLRHEKETVIREANKGDSAMLARYGIQLRDNERLILLLRNELEHVKSEVFEHKTDTVCRVDSVPKPYPVEKELTAWQHAKVAYGGYALGICMAGFIVFILGLRKKLPP